MVMKKNAMGRNLQRAILRSIGRYIALILIIALGSGLFIGLQMTKSDIVATGQAFMDGQNMFDLRLLTMYGWSKEHVEEISRQEGVASAEGVIYAEYVARAGDADTDSVYRFYELPTSLNLPYLRAGRMPEKEDECLVDAASAKLIGKKVVIQSSNSPETLETIRVKEFTVVGSVASPLHIDMSRSTTTVGNGSINSFIYVPQGVLDLDYIPEVHVTLSGENDIYTDRYRDAMKAGAEALEPSLQSLAEARLRELRGTAEEAYQEGVQALIDGRTEYQNARLDAYQQLQDARAELLEGERQIAEMEQMLIDGEEELENGIAQLHSAEQQLAQGRANLENAKVTAEQTLVSTEAELTSRQQSLTAQIATVDASLAPIDAELGTVNAELASLQASAAPIEAQIQGVNAKIAAANGTIASLQGQLGSMGEDADPAQAAAIQAQITQQQALIAGYNGELAALQSQLAQYSGPIAAAQARKSALEGQRAGIAAQKASLEQQLSTVNQSIDALPEARNRVAQEIAAQEAQLENAARDIANGYIRLAQGRQELEDGKVELEEARQELKDGWAEFEEARLEALAQFDEPLRELHEAELRLADAKERLDAIVVNRSTILNRDSNAGYANLENSTNIVQGISRVFPVFFLLVASLVCITTMTRMIDEERTEIGTLKALGYTNNEIARKYLLYSGSGALVGCVLGVIAGNTVIPSLLWDAYGVSFYMQPDVVYTVNPLLCVAVILLYVSVLLLVTWYCCRKTLQDVPAELIRPKAPDAGKALFVERLPFWNRLGFLNKVMIRNIFRYRQRLAMMLVGIGGCMALLLTGFGIRDSLVSVVDIQFEEVTVYDMSVIFQDPLTPESKADFLDDTKDLAQDVAFYHQSVVDLLANEDMREINLLCTQGDLRGFIDMHSGKDPVAMPGPDQLVLTRGTAQELGLEVGDTVILRNADLHEMALTLSGIYDNHVFNYAIVAPATVEQHWGTAPEEQMAFLTVREGMEVHNASAKVAGLIGIMDVSVSEDQAALVESLLGAIEMVVYLAVICAGMLAVIVLYNLTNINITERIREIATIKVLGFNARETGAYVFKENMALTIAGAAIGLGLGWLLLDFVIAQIKVDSICFKPILTGGSYVWAVALTILSALAVDFIFYFKLQRINMAEALKSVE